MDEAAETDEGAVEELFFSPDFQELWSPFANEDGQRRDLEAFFRAFLSHHLHFTYYLGLDVDSGLNNVFMDKAAYKAVKKEVEELLEARELPTARPHRVACPQPRTFASLEEFRALLRSDAIAGQQRRARKDQRRARDLAEAAATLTRARELVAARTRNACAFVAVALDVEEHEGSPGTVTEVGACVATRRAGCADTVEAHHFVVEEAAHLRNGKFVPDNRDNFAWGETCTVPLSSIKETVKRMMKEADCVVLHGMEGIDRRFFEDLLGAPLVAADAGEGEVVAFDSQVMRQGQLGSLDQMSLSSLVTDVAPGSDLRFLHNAGNDAYHTMEAFLALVNDDGPEKAPGPL